MIDATKSPTAAWKRYATIVVLAVLIAVAGYVLYTKELHHSSSSSSSGTPAATAPVKTSPSVATKSSKRAPTTIPGGLPVSSRNPFGG